MSLQNDSLLIALVSLCMACSGAQRQASPEPSTLPQLSAKIGQRDSEGQEGAHGESRELPDRLTPDHIVPVIAEVAPRVKTTCWQPSLDERPADAPTTLRIVAHAIIGPSGVVTRVDVDDAPAGYPNLQTCVAELVRSLRFPPATGPTTVNIPFVFDARDPAAGSR
jgi:hypothetical protein